MKLQIRNQVFETNSSSVHSLVISKDGLETSKLSQDKDGKILVDFGKFGNDYHLYESQEEKLSYLITLCYYTCGGWDVEDVYENSDFQRIEEIVCEYTGATGIKIIGGIEPEIDHKSQPYNGIEIINVWDKDEVVSFVFNKNVALKTDCD